MASIEMKPIKPEETNETKESDEGKKEQEMKDKQYEIAKNKMHEAFKAYKRHLSNEPPRQKIDQNSAHEDDFYYPEKIEWDNQKKKLFDDAKASHDIVKKHEDDRKTKAANRAALKTSGFFGLGAKRKVKGPDGESIVLEGGRKTRKHKKRRKHKKHRRTKRKHRRTKRKHHKKKRKTRKHKKKVVKRKRR